MPFSPIVGKSLLQIVAEKIAAFNRCYRTSAHLAIMTSSATDAPVRALLSDHHHFGLSTIDLLSQPSLPLLDMDGNPIVTDSNELLLGPDGNGSVFRELMRSGVYQRWQSEGVEAVSIIMYDNPLIDPFCPALFAPLFTHADLTLAAIERTDPMEQVGLIVQEQGQTRVIEYSEIDPASRTQRNSSGHLMLRWANISAFACRLSFIAQAASLTLPLHVARKTVAGRQVWKAEYFVFDAMAATDAIAVVALDRNRFFAPVKDPATLEQARQAMMARDRHCLSQLTGRNIDPTARVELSPSALYPTRPFLQWLRTSAPSDGVIDAGESGRRSP
jgi:UDP-N-acetylglucosamine/UDP-N-acetylgalactosamine diphosphorylase